MFELDANVENLTLDAGIAIATGRGNALSNVITGNAGSNALHGYEGNDTLRGGGGTDTLDGGVGNDVYVVDSVSDVVVETSAGGGIDQIVSTANRTLGAFVEDLILSGTAAVNGTGNNLVNGIAGNVAANTLIGLGGNDTLFGDAGNDTLRGGVGADTLMGGSGADVLIGGASGDTFVIPGINASPASARDIIRSGDGALAFEGVGAAGGDRCDLSAIDANETVAGNQSFTIATSPGVGRLWLTTSGTSTVVNGDVDGDAIIELQFVIEDGGILAADYRGLDFML